MTEPADRAPARTDASDDATLAADADRRAAARARRLPRPLLRKTAEFDNYRKRVERERREQADQAVVDLLLELLLVVDDFDRALTRRAATRATAPQRTARASS